MRRAFIATAAVLALVAAVPRSYAATVSGELGFDRYGQTWTLRVDAAPGELNRIQVRFGGGIIHVADSAPLTPGADCETSPDGGVTCEQARYTSAAIDIDVGDLHDSVKVDTDDEIPVRLAGGAGADTLRGSAWDDTLFGGRGRDVLRGGDGRDRLNPGPGKDVALAGAANDLVLTRDGYADEIDCGPGRDRLRNDRLDRQRRPRCERHDDAEVLGMRSG
jgi:hypothetical protein